MNPQNLYIQRIPDGVNTVTVWYVEGIKEIWRQTGKKRLWKVTKWIWKKKTEISETKLCQIHLREIFNRLYLAEERIISYLEGKAEETFPEYITESQR